MIWRISIACLIAVRLIGFGSAADEPKPPTEAEIREAKVFDAIAEMIKVSRISRQAAGVIVHGFYANLDDPTAVRFYGEFEDVEALRTQIKSQHEVAFKEVMAALGFVEPTARDRYP